MRKIKLKHIIIFLVISFVIYNLSIFIYNVSKIYNKFSELETELPENNFIEVLPDSVIYTVNSVGNGRDSIINFSDKEEIIFINFWATYCKPCLKEFNSIEKLFEDYKNEVNFYIISTEKNELVSEFIESHEWSLPFFTIKDNEQIQILNSTIIPRTYIIKNNVIYMSKYGEANWNDQKVRSLIEGLR